MREQRLRLSSEASGTGEGYGVKEIRQIRFSRQPKDFRWMEENVPCQDSCPASTNIPAYIRTLYEERYGRSYELNRIANVFPGVLGRICSRPCEEKCRHGEKDLGEPVGICHIKRAASDQKSPSHRIHENLFASTGMSVAVVGGGPAGLACAHDLACFGFDVTVFEARKEAGGMLTYGIPRFRLSRDVIRDETNNILRLGVEFQPGSVLGQDIQASELLDKFNSVVVATGCYSVRKLNVEGEELDGVVSGLDYMMEVNSGGSPGSYKNVVVIGGGFTAMDCARTAMRLGAETVKVAILTTEEDMFATKEEIHEAKREGVEIVPLLMSRRFVEGANGRIKGLELVRTRPGRVMEDGMREPIPIEGSEFVMDADAVIVAIGQAPDPDLFDVEVNRDEWGRLVCDPESFSSGVPNLYLTGDYATGASTVIGAVGIGRETAKRVTEDLLKKPLRTSAVRFEAAELSDRERAYDFIERVPMPTMPVAERLTNPNSEVELGLTNGDARTEASRCYLCYLKFTIDVDRCIYCRYCIDVAPRDCIKLAKDVVTDNSGHVVDIVETSNWDEVMAVVIDNKRCIRCGNCYRICPTRCIGVTKVELVETDLEAMAEVDQ